MRTPEKCDACLVRVTAFYTKHKRSKVYKVYKVDESQEKKDGGVRRGWKMLSFTTGHLSNFLDKEPMLATTNAIPLNPEKRLNIPSLHLQA